MNRKYRKTVIAGNWKMNMLASEIKPFMEELRAAMPAPRACDVVLCTPAVMIPTMVKAGKEAKVAAGGQVKSHVCPATAEAIKPAPTFAKRFEGVRILDVNIVRRLQP